MTNMTPDPESHGRGWMITGQTERQQLGGDGQFQDGVTVAFQTQHGVAGTVWVPRSRFTPETVRQAVTQQAATLDQVSYLTPDA